MQHSEHDIALIKRAAEAMDYNYLEWIDGWGYAKVATSEYKSTYWNPLIDSFDAIILITKLGITVSVDRKTNVVYGYCSTHEDIGFAEKFTDENVGQVTRYIICMVASAIGAKRELLSEMR